MAETEEPVSLFHSYSHRDEEHLDGLREQLAPLRRDGVINEWHDRKIGAGGEWKGKIDERLKTADIILLLISPAFLDSDYCYDVEMERALERHDAGEARVIPVILRPCMWEERPFAKLQAVPKDGEAITTWDNKDKAYLDVARAIKAAVEDLRGRKPPPPPVQRKARTRQALKLSIAKLPRTGKDLFGRKEELKLLTEAWHDPDVNVISLVAWGGVGKSALVNSWLAEIAKKGYFGAERVFA
jgi:hypothetical protein